MDPPESTSNRRRSSAAFLRSAMDPVRTAISPLKDNIVDLSSRTRQKYKESKMLPAKLKLLIWKNFLLQRRHKWQTFFEIMSPVIFSSILIIVRFLIEPESKPAINYPPFLPISFDPKATEMKFNTELKLQQRNVTFAFSPDTPLTKSVVIATIQQMANQHLRSIARIPIRVPLQFLPIARGYTNAKTMENVLMKKGVMDTVLAGIEFEDSLTNATEWPKHIKFALRFPAIMRSPMVELPIMASWRTNSLFEIFPKPEPRFADDLRGGKNPGYAAEMFLAVQHCLSLELIKAIAPSASQIVDSVPVYMQRFPQLAYRKDKLLTAMEQFISMIIMLSFAYTAVSTVKVVATEKELQLKETMRIMGVRSWLHWVAWFVKQYSFLIISVVIMVTLFKIPWQKTTSGERLAVFNFTPASILIFILLLYIMASLAFCFMVSVFFARVGWHLNPVVLPAPTEPKTAHERTPPMLVDSTLEGPNVKGTEDFCRELIPHLRPNTAASFMGMAWFASYAPYVYVQSISQDVPTTAKMFTALFSNTAMGYIFEMCVISEGSSGLHWGNIFKPVSYQDSFTPGHAAVMLMLDTVIYYLITIYVEKISPGSYGVPLPWYYPFSKDFWFKNSKRVEDAESGKVEYPDGSQNVVHEEEPHGRIAGVHISNLTKVYQGSKKAVDNLNLNLYENDITILLGHNGAGKTTTISMLTGMIKPTSGSALINGYDIVKETAAARMSLGLCPQHDVLFPDLTVAEHIEFYSKLKGIADDKVKEEVDKFIRLLTLEEKRNVLSSQLSGGQKRRLSVAAAMCGTSQVVLLDEPTSGLDPASRRALWDLLLQEKKGRTIILSTHFMDEADILGDRIAIMSGGRLQCVGTPYFLKNYYGSGYKLIIAKAHDCNPELILDLLKKHVPEAQEHTNIGSELSYLLPKEMASKFSGMLKELEVLGSSLGVASYGLTITTIEDVFMKAGAEKVSQERRPSQFSQYSSSGEDSGATVPADIIGPINKVTGTTLQRNHIKAMFLKHGYSTMRQRLQNSIQLLMPVINIIFSMMIVRSWKFLRELPALPLNLWNTKFKHTRTLLSRNEGTSGLATKALETYRNMFSERGHRVSLEYLDFENIEDRYKHLYAANPELARSELLVGATFSPTNITAWFGNYGLHDPAISLALADNAIMQAASPGSSLTVYNKPMPFTFGDQMSLMASGSSIGWQLAFNLGFCFTFVTAFFVMFTIKERMSGSKLLQRASGVTPAVMWGCAYIWDWLWFCVITLVIMLTLAAFQEQTYSTFSELGRLMLTLLVFGFGTLPVHYLLSFFFNGPATGFSRVCFINIFTGLMPFLIHEILCMPEITESSPNAAYNFDRTFVLVPHYCISRILKEMSLASFALTVCDSMCDQFIASETCNRRKMCTNQKIQMCCIDDQPYFQWNAPGVGRYVWTMGVVGIFAFVLLMLLEYQVFSKLWYKVQRSPPRPAAVQDDSDVQKETELVHDMSKSEINNYSLVSRDLTKHYGKFLAVNQLSFAVRKAECFGLLGVNGAGKTTTFKMLTGDERISSGDAFVHGLSIKNDLREVHKIIGYCPQFDALLDNLTGWETFKIYCLLRGIPINIGSAIAEDLSHQLGITKHLDKKVYQYSGGNKRKLSTAVALLGDAPLVFLDEPTTGMDPASKRRMWSVLSAAVRAGRSAVLTTHSMEECEALCTRLTIMAGGRMHCLGSLQHLKNKFSSGYTLVVKCASGPQRDEALNNVHAYITTGFPNSNLMESYLGISTYDVPEDVKWWEIFERMEAARDLFPIEDYSVTQTSLEQIFMRFSRQHNNTQVCGHDT